jgi:metallo-beta-lactamase family protein
VTGSRHLVSVGKENILLDCGLYQGRRDESDARNRTLPFDPGSLEAVVLSHAHIDHSGNLPTLAKNGYRGPIHATSATTSLCSAMLMDSAHIQVKDAEFVNKHPARRGPRHREPLYTAPDAEEALRLFRSHPYGSRIEVARGMGIMFHDAGHILGSSFIEADLHDGGVRRKLVFSGDLGRPNLPIIRDPSPPPQCDVLLIESTYGDRKHADPVDVPDLLASLVNRVVARGGKILIPAFAVGRVQEVVMILKGLIDDGKIRRLPVYVDSPLATNVTEIFSRHAECYDQETLALLNSGHDPFGFSLIHYVRDVEESKALNTRPEPCIIIAPSGMCEAGRILHHLRNNITDPENLILIVGFQAEHTLGRRLAEQRDAVRIFGEEFERRAEVAVMDHFSAHADRDELLGWLSRAPGRPGRIFVIHGNEDQSEAFAATLRNRGYAKVEVPMLGQEYEL